MICKQEKNGIGSSPENTGIDTGLKRLSENCAVPEGTQVNFPLYPGLAPWAKLIRPCGAGDAAGADPLLPPPYDTTCEAVPFHRISRIRLLQLSAVLVAILYLSLCVINASAQTSGNSSLSGVVADPTGAVV